MSVIISTRNRAGCLPVAIESVLAQSFDALELIIIDDGSTDDTQAVLARYRENPKVVTIHNRDNRGLPAALNQGIAQARGEFMARLDDDDYWIDPLKLQRQFEQFRENPDLGVLGTAYRDEWDRAVQNPLDDASIRQQMLMRCPFCHSSVMVRMSTLREVGGYDQSLPYAEDWELWLRMGDVCQMGNLPDLMLAKGKGDHTLSERYFQQQLKMAGEFSKAFRGQYPSALKALWYHRVNRLFFGIFPVDGWLHRRLRTVFMRYFQLGPGG